MFGSNSITCIECGMFVPRRGKCKRCTTRARLKEIASKRRRSGSPDLKRSALPHDVLKLPCGSRSETTFAKPDKNFQAEEETLKFCSDESSDCASGDWKSYGSFFDSWDKRFVDCTMENTTPLTCAETDSSFSADDEEGFPGVCELVGDPLRVFPASGLDDAVSDSSFSSASDSEAETIEDADTRLRGYERLSNSIPCTEESSVISGCSRRSLTRFCLNCKREALQLLVSDPEDIKVELKWVNCNEVAFTERKWRTFSKAEMGSRNLLCKQCESLLSKEKRRERKNGKIKLPWRYVWPVYMWKLLCHPDMMGKFGSDIVHWIPKTCHRFWESRLKVLHGSVYKNEKFRIYEDSIAVLKDVTEDKRAFVGALKRNCLGELKQACNRYLIPNVLCPWGCTSYLHDCGNVSYDAIINRYFPFVEFAGSLCTPTERKKVNSARGDFLDSSIDMHLYNEEWSVHPSVEFRGVLGPVILTCDSHDGGTAEKYFHLPKSDCILPSSHPDVLSHAVVNAKILHRTQAHQYSTTYQLNKCTGSYSGIECSFVSDNRRFDFISHLTDVHEARSYAGRIDIRGLVSRLEKQRVIPALLAESFAARAEELFSDKKEIESLTKGATMMTLYDSMKLQGMLSSHPVCSLVIDCDSNYKLLPCDEHCERNFLRQWPSNLIHIHPNDGYGCKLYSIPAMQSRNGADLRLCWNLCHMILCVPIIWERISLGLGSTSQWYGYFLAYLSKNILSQTVNTKQETNPFAFALKDVRNTPKGLMDILDRYCCRKAEGLGRTRRSEKTFCPSDFELVFSEEIDGGRMIVSPFPDLDGLLANTHGSLSDDCNVLVFYRPDISHDDCFRLPEEISTESGVIFELRFMTASSEQARSKSKGVSWNSDVWVRHGGGVFDKWWRATRSPSSSPLQEENVDNFPWESMDVAVYVRKRVVILEQYRQEYLKYIGGQNKIGCKGHEVPLITCQKGKRGNQRICGLKTECRDAAIYTCPVVGCNSGICKSCFDCLPGEQMTMMQCVECTTHESIRSFDGDSASINALSVGCGDGSSVSEDDLVCQSCDSGESERDSVVSNGESYSGLATGAECAGFGTGDFAPDSDSDEEEEEAQFNPLIPTTVESSSENAIEGSSAIIGTSVLLNKCGTMLVRRNTQLQASRRERHVLEKIVSRKDVGTVPLLYLEGMLFPSVFWCLSHSSDGGILGSTPTSFFCQNSTRKRFGVASMADHAKTRLKSIGNTASTDPRYLTFLFDSLANGAVEGQDTRIVLSRGFEESMGPAGMRIRNKGDDLYSDTIDNRQCVHDLCAGERIDSSDVFVTMTCNQREHFGISNVKRYIDDGGALKNYKAHWFKSHPNENVFTDRSEQEIQKALQEASMNLTVRNWMEVRLILIRYLLKSPEMPFGCAATDIFARDEYQGDKGNLSHLHMLVKLEHKYSTDEGKKALHGCIRGFVDDVVTVDEVDDFIEEGLITDWDDYYHLKNQASSYLSHHCSERCLRRTGPGESDLVCRVPDARISSCDLTEFSDETLDVKHRQGAIDIMSRLGLCHSLEETDGIFCPREDFLESKRIHAPARHGEGNISPVVGRLFAATRSTMNIQICTSNGTTRYVVKYLTKIDENNYITFRAKQKEKDVVKLKADKVFLHNTKISSSAINEAKKLNASRDRDKEKGRAIANTEMIQLMLGFPQVQTSMEFVRVSTLPLGERPGIERECPQELFDKFHADGKKDAFSVMVPSVMTRKHLFTGKHLYRVHTPSQVTMLQDQMLSRVTLDKVFLFSIRPPELLFVDKMEWYFRLFKRSTSRCYNDLCPLGMILSTCLHNSPLVDGLGHEIKLRVKGIPLLKKILLNQDGSEHMDNLGYGKMKKLFLKIIEYFEVASVTQGQGVACRSLTKGQTKEWNNFQKTFVDFQNPSEKLPIVVHSNVKPCNTSKFIIHLLLSMGRFVTERDIWTNVSVSEAFFKAGLLPNPNEPTRDDVDNILKEWIMDQLRFYPIGTQKLDEYIISAENILISVLIDNVLPINEIPPVMYTSLVQQTDKKIQDHCQQCKSQLIDATLKAITSPYQFPGLVPSKDQLMSSSKGNPISWNPRLPKSDKQSDDSYDEQWLVQTKVMNLIDFYSSPGTSTGKNLLIAGPPGVGKTHCMSHGIIYAICKGLTTMTTAMLADRALMLGGRHLHKLFALRVRDHGSPHRLAELAIISLQKKPHLFAFLRKLDVLFMDECGQVNAELLSVLDIVMRKVRDSSLFLGGIMIIGTIDQVQLRPINGLPFLLSPYILTTFSIMKLKCYVRCAECQILQEMNELARFLPRTEEEWKNCRARMRYLITNNCTFADSWNSLLITDDVMRIFPRREETSKAIKMFLDQKRADVSRKFLSVTAKDTMVAMESHADWRDATPTVSLFLNSKLREPDVLHFYKGALYQFTHNIPGSYSATQLCILLDVPSYQQLVEFEDIEVVVAPPGVKSVGTNPLPSLQSLLENGWYKEKVGVAPQHALNLWNHGVKAKRKQYGLRHHIASTIHSAIGHTVSKIATEMSPGKDMWEKAMVVVLISRVSTAKDLIFVGNKKDNIDAVMRGLSLRNQYDEYMNHIVEALGSSRDCQAKPVRLSTHPFRQKDLPIPDDRSGVVYLLVSVNEPASMYIGFTKDMVKRIKQHNSGIGASQSADPSKRPWGLLAYVTGFGSDKSLMRRFELQWQNYVRLVRPSSALAAAGLAHRLIDMHYKQDYDLQAIIAN